MERKEASFFIQRKCDNSYTAWQSSRDDTLTSLEFWSMKEKPGILVKTLILSGHLSLIISGAKKMKMSILKPRKRTRSSFAHTVNADLIVGVEPLVPPEDRRLLVVDFHREMTPGLSPSVPGISGTATRGATLK